MTNPNAGTCMYVNTLCGWDLLGKEGLRGVNNNIFRQIIPDILFFGQNTVRADSLKPNGRGYLRIIVCATPQFFHTKSPTTLKYMYIISAPHMGKKWMMFKVLN